MMFDVFSFLSQQFLVGHSFLPQWHWWSPHDQLPNAYDLRSQQNSPKDHRSTRESAHGFLGQSWEPKGTLPMPHPPPKKFSALKGGTIKPWAPSQGETHSIHDFPPPRSTFWGCVFWYAFLSPRWVPTTRELQPNWHPSFSHRVLVPFFRKNNMADQQGD